MITKVIGAPGQPLAIGVTVIVSCSMFTPVLIAVNPAILPAPDGAKPILEFVPVQL